MKCCSKCKQEKPLFDFFKSKRTKDGLQHQCKSCANTYYQRPGTLEKYVKRVRAKDKEKRQMLNELKQTLSSTVCGETASCCLEFHHMDPSTKDDTVSNMVGKRRWDAVLAEIEKCVVLCANCHRKVHDGMIAL